SIASGELSSARSSTWRPGGSSAALSERASRSSSARELSNSTMPIQTRGAAGARRGGGGGGGRRPAGAGAARARRGSSRTARCRSRGGPRQRDQGRRSRGGHARRGTFELRERLGLWYGASDTAPAP